MTVRYYLIPVEVVGSYRGPKYFNWRFSQQPGALNVMWSMKDYGLIDQAVIAADVSEADHTYLAGKSDVFWDIPPDLPDIDGQPPVDDMRTIRITSQERTDLSNYLETIAVPAQWITNEYWADVLRIITGMFLYMQRLTAITGDTPLDWGITLNTQFQNLTQEHQDAIIQAGTDLGFDVSWIVPNMTIRNLLKNMADQWGSKAIHFGFTTL